MRARNARAERAQKAAAAEEETRRKWAKKGLSAYSYFVAYGMQNKEPAYRGETELGIRTCWWKM